MCRWFVYVSATEDCLLEDVLVTPKHGLSRMVNDHYLPGLLEAPANSAANKEAAIRDLVLNIDGLGIAWYTMSRSEFERDVEGPRPALYKSISPPLNDFNYRALCANISTKFLFAHVRASSGAFVAPANCHPFVFGRYTFMHNGVVSGFQDIRRQMCGLLDKEAFGNVNGSTDTEHLAALYMTLLSDQGKAGWDKEYSLSQMLESLYKAVSIVIELQKEVLGSAAKPSSLNLAVGDGNRLVCIRVRNHRTQRPPSLYYSTTAGVTLNRKYPSSHDGTENLLATKTAEEHGTHLIVASEPTTFNAEEWHLIEKNSYVCFEKGGQIIRGDLPWNNDWYLEDNSLV